MIYVVHIYTETVHGHYCLFSSQSMLISKRNKMMPGIYLLVCAVVPVFNEVKIKCEINTVCKLDQKVHRVAIATVFLHCTCNNVSK